MTGPLHGIRIVEVASVITGPWAASLLADQGASVIKIEAPGGDIMRASGHLRGGVGSWFVNLNRGKRSIVVDLTTADGLAIAHALVAEADVFIENWRPGVAERLGLGPEALGAINPELIHASVTGFGHTGPLAGARAYDPTVQGRSGIVATQSNDRVDDPQPVRIAISDQVTSLTVSQAITAALFARAQGAGGQHLHLSMLEASLQFLWPVAMSDHTFVGEGVTPGIMYGPTQRYWSTTDGAIMAAVAPDKEWTALCAVTGRDDWRDDPRFVDIGSRLRHFEEMMEAVGTQVATLSTAEAEALFESADVPYSPAVPRDGLWDEPQVAALGAVEEVDHPHLGRLRRTRPPVTFAATPAEAGRPAPLLGEHTDEVLLELGWALDAIAAARAAGTVA
jgi:crotonobetainyl-CoA:carnitine CoA-transferase CaiB-like acyl-CoA transferase